MEAIVGRIVLEVVIVRQLVRDLRVEKSRRLVAPASRDIADRVTAAAHDERGQTEALDKVDAHGMTLERQVEAAEAIARERVSAALQGNRSGTIALHDGLDDGLEDALVALIVYAVLEREVQRVVLTSAIASVLRETNHKSVHQDRTQWRQKGGRTRISPVPGKNSPNLWKEQVRTRFVLKKASSTPSPW